MAGPTPATWPAAGRGGWGRWRCRLLAFAPEPKFVFPEGAVGIENTFVATKDGLENLTVFDAGIIYI